MGKRKEVIYHEGKLQGKLLTDAECTVLDKLIHISLENGSVTDLKNCIYYLSEPDVDRIKAQKSSEGIDKTLGTLEDTQTVGVAYMYYAKRLVLGDSVGMGKTVELCGLFNLLRQKRRKEGYDFNFLYLTEKNLVAQTRDETIRFTGEYVDAVYGDAKSVNNFLKENKDEVNYSIVASHSIVKNVNFQEYIRTLYKGVEEGQKPFDILVVDEAGILSNQNTQMYKMTKVIADMFDYVIILNATSFEKNLAMFYSQIAFIDDTLLPTKTDFNKRYVVFNYTGPYPVPTGKYKNAEEFRALVGYRYFARTRKSTGAYMKDCSADVLVSDLSQTQKWLLGRTNMPHMVYDCPSYFYKDGSFEDTVDNTPKLKDLLTVVNMILEMDEQVLIYATYKEAQSSIQRILFENSVFSVIMNGETDIKEKNSIIDKFKSGSIKVLITNVQKGLNFGHCNYCVFYNYDPNPNKMVQFEGRMTREHNIVGKHVYLLISRGKELSKFKSVVADRAQASDLFAGSDFSCVMSLLLDNDKINTLK